MTASREFDFIIFGATGFTGRLVAEYIAARVQNLYSCSLSGRDSVALKRMRGDLTGSDQIPIVVADASDRSSLRIMVKRTRIVLSLVGPYSTYGSNLVELCAENGTDYVDISVELPWMRQMIDRYEAVARASGARIVFSCGFASLPLELGIRFLQKLAVKRFGHPLPQVKARIHFVGGGFSAGTVDSLRTMIRSFPDGLIGWWRSDPFALSPNFVGEDQPECASITYDSALEAWLAPSVFTPINRANLHRSNMLSGWAFGANFTYEEMMYGGPGVQGEATARTIAAMNESLANGSMAGVGPDAEARQRSRFKLLFQGRSVPGEEVHVTLSGRRDAGYGATSRMISEAAICLLERAETAPPGIWTPAALLGDALYAPLAQHAELSIAEDLHRPPEV